MPKHTAYILLAIAVAGVGAFVLMNRAPARGEREGTDPGNPEPTTAGGDRLPEERVLSVTERLYALGRRVYDDVQSRRAPAAQNLPAGADAGAGTGSARR